MSSYLISVNNQDLKNVKLLLVIVMNKYSQKDREQIETLIKTLSIQVEIYYPDKNLGYLNGLLAGYRFSNSSSMNESWTVFSNVDIEFGDNQIFQKIAMLETPDDVYCVAPSVYEPRMRRFVNPQYLERYSKKSLEFRIWVFKKNFLANSYIQLGDFISKYLNSKEKQSQYVYSAHGSFFILKKDFLKNLGKDYMSLLYSEEAFIAEEVRLAAGRVYYDNSIKIIHLANESTGKLSAKRRNTYLAESLEKIIKEYY
jgi:GT2 family glycosyltransferase